MSTRLEGKDVLFTQRLLASANLYDGRIDGIWGPKTERGARLFDERTDAIADELGRFDARTERNIGTLHPSAQRAARRFMHLARDAGFEVRVISGTRTYAEQQALFRQGRYGNPGPIVTRARAGFSNHNFGIAWDIGVFRGGNYLTDSASYDAVADACLPPLTPGVEWGGNWRSFKDRPHYELSTGLNLTGLREAFERGGLEISLT